MRAKRKMRQLLSALAALCLTLTSAAPFAAAEEAGNPLAERGEQVFAKLTALGILNEEEGYISGGEMSRGVFTRLVMKIGGDAPAILYPQDTVFADVSAATENADYIAAAYTLGYINGNPEGNFYPENSITCAEALKLMSGVLGYGLYAEENGGYPTGYLKTANRLSLLSGLGVTVDTPLTWDHALMLLDNASEADLMEVVKIGETVEMQVIPGQTLLSRRFSIYMTEAVVEANAYTDLMSPDSDLEEDMVRAEGITYRVGSTNAVDCLGKNMELYYYDDGAAAVPELLYITPLAQKNKVLELNPEEIRKLTVREISYSDETGKGRTAKLSPTATLIWNGKMAELTEEKLKPDCGSVTLISSDGDLIYDVILVMSYESYVVSAVSASSEAVGTKQGKSLSLDESDSSCFTVIRSGESRVGFEAIKRDQVISYAESEPTGKVVKTAVLSDKTITGTIETVRKEDKTLTIGGMEYKTTEELVKSLKPGREGTFYVDAFDRVVYIGGTLDIVYGYLNGLRTEMFGEVTCRIFTENNRWVTLNMNGKVKFNGNSTDAEKVAQTLGSTPESYRQLIRYLVNTEGKITTLDTAKPVTMGTDEEKKAIADNTFRLSASGNKNYRNGPRSFDGVVTVGGDAKLFIVPNQSDGSREEDFDIKGQSDLAQDSDYVFEAYDANSVRTSAVFVLTNYTQKVNTGSAIGTMMLVQEVCQALNSDMVAEPAVRGYWKGTEFTMAANPKTGSPVQDVNTLQKGDIIQFTYNNKGEMDYIEKKYTAGTEYSLTGNLYASVGFVAGAVLAVDIDEKRAVFQYDAGGSAAVYSLGSAAVYIYEPECKRFTIGSQADLMEGDQIFVSVRYLECKELFVIRN